RVFDLPCPLLGMIWTRAANWDRRICLSPSLASCVRRSRYSSRGVLEKNRRERLGNHPVPFLVQMDMIGKEVSLFIVEHSGEIINPTRGCRRNRILIHAPRQHCHSEKEKIVRLRQLGLSGWVIAAREQRRLKHEHA